MQLTRASLKDLPFLVEVYNASIPSRLSTADIEPVSVESKLDWFNQHGSSRPIFIVEFDGQRAGWVGFSDFYGRPAYASTAELSIYLKEEYRGKGLGTSAAKEMINIAPSLGISNLLAFVFAHNHASIHMFEKIGFNTWGYLPGVATMEGEKMDLKILGLKLT